MSRKLWTASEESIFLRIWFNNLVALHSCQNKDDVYQDMVAQLRALGIKVTKKKVSAKRTTFKKRFENVLNDKKAQERWQHFGKMLAITRYEQAITNKDPKPQVENSTSINQENTVQKNCMDVETTTSSDKPALRRKRSKTEYFSAKLTKFRRTWSQNEDKIFLNVWLKFVRELQGDRVKNDVHKEMALDLRGHGIDFTYMDVKHRIEQFIRKYRKEHGTAGSDSKWIFYAKVHQLLNNPNATTFDESLENDEIISIADDSWPWLYDELEENTSLDNDQTKNDEHLLTADGTSAIKTSANQSLENYDNVQNETNLTRLKLERSSLDIDEPPAPNNSLEIIGNEQTETETNSTACIKMHRLSVTEDEPPAKKSKSIDTNAQSSFKNTDNVPTLTISAVSSSNVIDLNDSDDIENELLQDDLVKESGIEKPNQDTCKPKLSDEYGQFVVKELNTLSEDLLIEAKRKIYNIICKLQMKQIELGKKSK